MLTRPSYIESTHWTVYSLSPSFPLLKRLLLSLSLSLFHSHVFVRSSRLFGSIKYSIMLVRSRHLSEAVASRHTQR